MWLFTKNLVFTVLVPGTVAVYIPYRIIKGRHHSFSVSWEILPFVAAVFIFIGATIYLWCLWDFAVTGRGTPAPIDAPKRLVITGLYRHVRNPMYIGVLCIILGWAILYKSYAVLQYAILIWVLFQGVVILVEEPSLRRQFDTSYKDYCKKVKRWIPGKGYKEAA